MSDVIDLEPIHGFHVWRVYDWHAGTWRYDSEVRTLTESRAVARCHAMEWSPVFRRTRFKVEYAGFSRAVPDGMELSKLTIEGSHWPSGRLADRHGEFAALRRENAKRTK